jgi:hypothetical protein
MLFADDVFFGGGSGSFLLKFVFTFLNYHSSFHKYMHCNFMRNLHFRQILWFRQFQSQPSSHDQHARHSDSELMHIL